MRNKVWSLWCALPNSPGVVFPTRRARQNSRRLVKRTSPSDLLGSTRRGDHAEKAVICFGNTLFARAYIRILFPEKSIHSFTRRVFSSDFHRFRVWRVGLSKYSHGSRSIHTDFRSIHTDFRSIHTGGEHLWRVERASLHTGKPPHNQEVSGMNVLLCCECLQNKAFTPKSYENQSENAFVWRGECFFPDKKRIKEGQLSG